MSRHKHECVECFDPKILDTIKCVCSLERLVDDVFRCLSCRPSGKRLQQVLTCLVLEDLQKIEQLLTNETFGLGEIKTEVSQIETIVQTINNTLNLELPPILAEIQTVNNNLNSPIFGLRKIETDIQTVNGNINNPAFGLRRIETDIQSINASINSAEFGLQEIKNEIIDIISILNSPTFGMEEIEKEVRSVENAAFRIFDELTTGPVFINENARHLTVQVLNNTSAAHTVNIRVLRIDKQPFQEIFSKNLEIAPFSSNEFRYISMDISECCDNSSGEIEVIINNMAQGLYPTIVQLNADDRIIPSSIFKSSDFIPTTENHVS